MGATTTFRRVGLITERNQAERRLAAVVKAVRAHERAQWTKPYPRRSDDIHLYRRVSQILGEES